MHCIAHIAGGRPASCMMPVPSRMRSVLAAIQASGVMASEPYASAVHTESKPEPLGVLDQLDRHLQRRP